MTKETRYILTIFYCAHLSISPNLSNFLTPLLSSCTIQLPFNHHSTTIQGVQTISQSRNRPNLSVFFTLSLLSLLTASFIHGSLQRGFGVKYNKREERNSPLQDSPSLSYTLKYKRMLFICSSGRRPWLPWSLPLKRATKLQN